MTSSEKEQCTILAAKVKQLKALTLLWTVTTMTSRDCIRASIRGGASDLWASHERARQ